MKATTLVNRLQFLVRCVLYRRGWRCVKQLFFVNSTSPFGNGCCMSSSAGHLVRWSRGCPPHDGGWPPGKRRSSTRTPSSTPFPCVSPTRSNGRPSRTPLRPLRRHCTMPSKEMEGRDGEVRSSTGVRHANESRQHWRRSASRSPAAHHRVASGIKRTVAPTPVCRQRHLFSRRFRQHNGTEARATAIPSRPRRMPTSSRSATSTTIP